jgi:ferredoxin-type protein NapF
MRAEPRFDPSRRAFLRTLTPDAPGANRLPWSDPVRLAELCTRCGDCLPVCDEGVLVFGDGGYPTVDFERGGCTFCGDCASVCKADVFAVARAQPWSFTAHVGSDCLGARGIVCDACRESCELGAVRIVRAVGTAPIATIEPEKCTGCGFCVSVCPADAISFSEGSRGTEG